MSGTSTVAVHADRGIRTDRSVAPPIYQTAAFSAADAETFAQAAVEPRGQDFYLRFGNPNHAQVAAVAAELERTEAAMVTASGMAAITTAVLALVSAGDHVIGQRSTYGGTASVLLNLLPRLGVSTTLVDQTDPTAFEKALTPQTRLILLETPSNPLLQVTDLRAVAKPARAHGVPTVADNTFATPLNQRPTDFGVDLVWHSATKYLNGHTDISAGVLAGPAGFATVDPARSCGLDARTGSLTPGKDADVILLRTDDITVFPVTDPVGTIVSHGHPGLVDTVLVAGRVVKRDGVLVDVDLRALRTRLTESRDRVAAAAGVPLDGTWRPRP
ncbi:aminotransferase class I/II-fold pyridoxal phosphate-dependent enzyme [Streptomyces sp. NPDC101234]|uniref:aminotransferase class I/II-fold pyridoxal phosphate-dependent enzyme n=1 Tax=Streptomyces sp. NPDC101234 TaxID=3366138 RepID=UPI003814FA66